MEGGEEEGGKETGGEYLPRLNSLNAKLNSTLPPQSDIHRSLQSMGVLGVLVKEFYKEEGGKRRK
jgi:hypothetical protein